MLDAFRKHTGKYLFSIFLICGFASPVLFGQQIPQSDSTATPAPQPASQSQSKPKVDDAVEYQSTDSLIVDFRNGRTATLFGSAKVGHEAGTLTSGKISMDLETNTVEAL